MADMDVVYRPQIVTGIARIGKAFGVGDRRVWDWIDEGAPIAAIRKGSRTYYSCEVMRLQQWLESHTKKGRD